MHEREYINIVWDYMKLNQSVKKADVIIVFGSYDPRVAEYAAQLYLDGMAPVLIFSGGQSDSTKDWEKSEAETFYDIARAMGVPEENILVEKESTNSGENIEFTKKLIQEKNLVIESAIVVQKTFMERRAYAALRKQWVSLSFVVTSPPDADFDYYVDLLGYDSAVGDVLGDLERIKKYPELGFQIKQDIPDKVWHARCVLRGQGYCKRQIEV